jgi:hypothetical protein
MVYIRINISEKTNRIINAIKEEYGFKNKGQVINFLMELVEKKYLSKEMKLSQQIWEKNIKNEGYRRIGHEKDRAKKRT